MAQELPDIQPPDPPIVVWDDVMGDGVEHEICCQFAPFRHGSSSGDSSGSSTSFHLVRICL